MSVELLRTAAPNKSDANFQAVVIISLLGLTLSLFALSLLGDPFASSMAFGWCWRSGPLQAAWSWPKQTA